MNLQQIPYSIHNLARVKLLFHRRLTLLLYVKETWPCIFKVTRFPFYLFFFLAYFSQGAWVKETYLPRRSFVFITLAAVVVKWKYKKRNQRCKTRYYNILFFIFSSFSFILSRNRHQHCVLTARRHKEQLDIAVHLLVTISHFLRRIISNSKKPRNIQGEVVYQVLHWVVLSSPGEGTM